MNTLSEAAMLLLLSIARWTQNVPTSTREVFMTLVADMDARETLTVAKRNSWSERVNQRHNAYLELYFAGAFRFSNSKRTLELSYPAKKLVVAMQSNRNGRLELGSNQFTILNNLVTIYLNEGINPPIDRLVELPKDVDSLRRLAARGMVSFTYTYPDGTSIYQRGIISSELIHRVKLTPKGFAAFQLNGYGLHSEPEDFQLKR